MIAVLFLAILCLEVGSTVPTHDPSLDVEWHEWKTKHGKTYNTVSKNEERLRRTVWEKNFKMIELHNWEYLEGKHDFTMAMNAFGDLTNTEFSKMMAGFRRQRIKKRHIFQDHLFLSVPKYVNWREQGYVTPVKNQGHCASGWAFSATGALEGQMFRKTGRLIALSEQNLLDCMRLNVTHGCSGGFMQYAFQYVKDNGGLATEESYPYKGQVLACSLDPQHPLLKIYIADSESYFMDQALISVVAFAFQGLGLKACITIPGPHLAAVNIENRKATPHSTDLFTVNICYEQKTYGVSLNTRREEALMKAVAKVGPISVAVDANHSSFQFYESGIYYEPQCRRVHLNHAVLVVGYGFEGEESDGNSYWLVKNSWGEGWGMKGYINCCLS